MFCRHSLALEEGTGALKWPCPAWGQGQCQALCFGCGELGIPGQGQGQPLEVKPFLLSFPRRAHTSRCSGSFMFEVSLCYPPAECRILGWKSVLCRILVYCVIQRDPMTFPSFVLLFSFSLWNFLGAFISGRLKFHNDVPSWDFFSLYLLFWSLSRSVYSGTLCPFLYIPFLFSGSCVRQVLNLLGWFYLLILFPTIFLFVFLFISLGEFENFIYQPFYWILLWILYF